MFKKILLFSFFIALFNFSSVLAGDAEKGKLYKKCAACHNAASGAKHKTGPNLWGIYGAKAAVQEGYKYSNWLKEAGIEWNDEALAAWISKRKKKPHILEKTLRKVR